MLCALLLAGAAPAQTIQGTVQDEVTGEAVAGAAILLLDMAGSVLSATRSTADGRFVLRSTAGDTVRIRAERRGFSSVETQPWVLRTGSTLDLELRVRPAPLTLDTITVTGRWRSRNRDRFEQRRRSEIAGTLLGEERLSRIRVPSASQKLAMLIPRVINVPDGTVRVRKRGGDFTGIPSCQPRFYVDGTRFPGDLALDALVQGTEIRAVEFYDDPRFAPAEFAMGTDPMIVTAYNPFTGRNESAPGLAPPCAIIVIWTEWGLGKP